MRFLDSCYIGCFNKNIFFNFRIIIWNGDGKLQNKSFGSLFFNVGKNSCQDLTFMKRDFFSSINNFKINSIIFLIDLTEVEIQRFLKCLIHVIGNKIVYSNNYLRKTFFFSVRYSPHSSSISEGYDIQ